MDRQQVAALTRALRDVHSRRQLDRLVSGLALGGPLATLGLGPVAAKPHKQHHKHKQKRTGAVTPPPSSPPSPPSPPALQLAFACPAAASPERIVFTGSETRVAQTFTAARNGRLRQIQVAVTKPAASVADYVVPLLPVIAGSTFPKANGADVLAVAQGDTTVVASFDGPPLVAGTVYAVAIARLDATGGDALTLPTRQGVACGDQLFFESDGFFPDPTAPDMIVSVFVA